MIILHYTIYLSSIVANGFIVLSSDNIAPNLDINLKSPMEDIINLLSFNIEPSYPDYLDEPELEQQEPFIIRSMFVHTNLNNAITEMLDNIIDDDYFDILPLELMVSDRLVFLSEGFNMGIWENIYTSLVADRYSELDMSTLVRFRDNQLQYLADYQNHYWKELMELHAQEYYLLYIGEHQDPLSQQLYDVSINIQGGNSTWDDGRFA